MIERKSQWELFLEEEENPKPKEKRCSICKKYKSTTEFGKGNMKCGLASECKECKNKKRRMYRDRDDMFWKRFWSKTTRVGGCLEWNGRYNADEVPICKYKGTKSASVRRIVYKLAIGPVDDDAFVLTTCNNKRCVRHSHMKVGTREEWRIKAANNIPTGDEHYYQLCPEKRPYGSRCGRAKLTEDIVREVRKRAANESGKSIAQSLGVWQSTISKILTGKTWKHVHAP